MNSNQEFGSTLRNLRTGAGFTLADLAERIGVDISYLSKIENGKAKPPSKDVIVKLAEVLSTDENKLLDLAEVLPDKVANNMKNKALSVFGKRLRQLRIGAGLTQEQLADKVGISHTYLSKVESGNKPPPSPKVLALLASTFRLDTNDLLILGGKMHKPSYKERLGKKLQDMKNLWRSTFKRRRWSAAAISAIITIAIIIPLLLVSPAYAITVGISPSSGSVTRGSTYSFTIEVAVENTDLLPLQSVELQIYDDSVSDIYTGLPLNTTPSTPFSGSAGSATISTSAGTNWGYASSSSRYGYGYGYSSGTYGYGYGTDYGYGYGYNSYIGSTSISYSVIWTPPSDWSAGTYNIRAIAYASSGDTSNAFTNATAATVTLSEASAAAAADDDEQRVRGGAPTEVTTEVTEKGLVTDVTNVVTSKGTFKENVVAQSLNREVSLVINKGNTGTINGQPIKQIIINGLSATEIADLPAPPTESSNILLAFDINLDGAIFTDPVDVVFILPDGVDLEDVVIGRYHDGEWTIYTDIVYNPEDNSVKISLTEFSTFALMTRP
ncbi:helix-turn-helix domain-containing protein, partial [Chloroflexota bacterium]